MGGGNLVRPVRPRLVFGRFRALDTDFMEPAR